MKLSVTSFTASLLIAFVALNGPTPANADVLVSTGYDDGTGSGGTPIPPNPWFGSPNTTFYGSASDLALAPASDPDLSGVLFQNTSAAPVTIQDVSITAFDLFTRARLTGPVSLDPGHFAIFADGDGSDSLAPDQIVSFTVNGQSFSFSDAITAAQPDGVLKGNIPFINGVETVPWTQIADVLGGGHPVPEPSSLTLLFGAMGLVGLRWRRK